VDSSHDITEILIDWDRDPQAALDRLSPLVYDELRRLAASAMRKQPPSSTLQPTALVHEAYLRLAGSKSIAWKDRGHFFALAARAMRLILVDSARKRVAQKRGAGKKTHLEEQITYHARNASEFLELNSAIEALGEWDSRKRDALELKYFGGLTREEIAESQGVSLGTVKRDLAIAEAFLRRQLSSSND
jgi:RNA polymerase sigma factor (TIGR02999 family)